LVEDHRPLEEGSLADYIPSLAEADSGLFGVAIASMDGVVYAAGDAGAEFSIQSISKPFVFALAVQDKGLQAVLAAVGVEPSGESFNAISLEPGTGRPANPMINAGAMLCTSLVEGSSRAERVARITGFLSACAGRELQIDARVASSEFETAHRNRALLHLMVGAGALQADVEETLGAYCEQCAAMVSARDLAVMAATLAGGGRNPVTGVAVIDEPTATRTLSVMASCGMYDFAGEWLLRVGLPAKSGVSGGILAASPSEFGIGTFSPPLDGHGNSVRGVLALRELSEQFDLHLLHDSGRAVHTVWEQMMLDAADGGSLVLVAAQGALEFAAAEQLLRAIDGALAQARRRPRTLALDLARVTRLHPVASQLLSARLAAHDPGTDRLATIDPGSLLASDPAIARFGSREEALEALAGRAQASR
jgi:glutaminase